MLIYKLQRIYLRESTTILLILKFSISWSMTILSKCFLPSKSFPSDFIFSTSVIDESPPKRILDRKNPLKSSISFKNLSSMHKYSSHSLETSGDMPNDAATMEAFISSIWPLNSNRMKTRDNA